MLLKNIRLIGFKSFADVTNIPIKGALTAVLGPNGCGKSNVVDAIRWVIGELSAKQLRGKSMADVIFNGSSKRQPLGQAAVELVFDNSLGRIGGEFAHYSELVLRREVVREGQSRYFINGTLARRRDIIDMFLGTGLGSRSYAIIEQGMIARLIEAKPDEMRVYLEEVAGISKYKERRKETENRMRHTEENLDRLEDVREELSKQMRHLKRQANAAERYQDYREQQLQLQSELLLLEWQKHADESQDLQQKLANVDRDIAKNQSELQTIETDFERDRLALQQATDEQQKNQQQYYEVGSEVARLEEYIKSQQQRKGEWQQELQHIEGMLQELGHSSEEQQNELQQLQQQTATLEPQREQLQQQSATTNQKLTTAEECLSSWRSKWEQLQQLMAEKQGGYDVAQNSKDHAQQQQQNLHERKQRLQLRLDELQITDDQQLSEYKQKQTDVQLLAEDLQQQWKQYKEQLAIAQQDKKMAETNWRTARDNCQDVKSHHAALCSVQQAALKCDDGSKQWLQHQNWSDAPRFAQAIDVNQGWEMAVETVLTGYMGAVCVDGIEDAFSGINQLKQGELTVIGKLAITNLAEVHQGWASLASQVDSQTYNLGFLQHIYIADSLQDAITMRAQCAAHESVVVKEGYWFGPNWVKVVKKQGSEGDVFAREAQIKELAKDIDSQEIAVNQLHEEVNKLSAHIEELQQKSDQCSQRYQQLQEELRQCSAKYSAEKARLDEQLQQQSALIEEIEDCDEQTAIQQNTIVEKDGVLTTLAEELESYKNQHSELASQQDDLQKELFESRQHAEQASQSLALLSQRHDSQKDKMVLLQKTLSHGEKQQEKLFEKQKWLHTQLSEGSSPLLEACDNLQVVLEKSASAEQALRDAEQATVHRQQQVQQYEELRHTKQESYQKLQQLQVDHKMNLQEYTIKQKTIVENLESQQLTLDKVRETIAEEANHELWKNRVIQIEQRISRLGPINMAAIEEYKTIEDRKLFLDKQHEDLRESLSLLQEAIKKIDKETKSQFQETFEKVNNGLKQLFPKIFGGGAAMLELTDADVLNAGVVIKAQPPGKKNSTIHMLSGGEKALTAIALVFSLFQLNPAPFCILDEVDAPLDDANVGRFCRLVKEMSDQVQFVIISHNKVTIEMADYLMGVTMQEPGVSRVVAVDVEQAVSMVEV